VSIGSGEATAADIERHLRSLADPGRVPTLQRFFKTGPGEYGEGDRFLGLRVPEIRKLSREYRGTRIDVAVELLQSDYHEVRLCALLLLVDAYHRADGALQNHIFEQYLANTRRVNSWDLVDTSAPHIVGAHLFERDRSLLLRLAASPLVWDRRIAIMATFHFIRRGQFTDTLRIVESLLSDPHDLIHKAAGWMLREIGQRDRACAEQFLKRYYQQMPRTMLRYAIERFAPERRRAYLDGSAGRR
jgi:3-methyladenine DNA glycosylase AlkD